MGRNDPSASNDPERDGRATPAAPEVSRVDELMHELHVHQIELETQNHELREAQSLLEESRSRYADLYDFAPVGYCTLTATGTILEINLTGAAMLGLDRARVLGRRLLELLPVAAAPALRAHLARCGASDGRVESDVTFANGLAVQVASVPDTRGPRPSRQYRTTFTDVTAQRRALDTLRWLGDASLRLGTSLDEPELLEMIVEFAVPFLADECHAELVVPGNEATLRVASRRHPRADAATRRASAPETGASPDNGDPLAAFAGLRATINQAIAARSTQHVRAPSVDVRGDVPTSVQAAMVVPLVTCSEVLGALTLVAGARRPRFTTDEQRVAEDFARRAATALSHARLYREARRAAETARREGERAEAASRAKDALFATVSHELRSPLTSILGWTGLLRAGSLAGERRERALEIVERSARVQAQLVADLLDTAAIMTGKVTLASMPVDLGAEVCAAVDALRPAAASKGVALELAVPDEPMVTDGDPDRLQQVVANLLSNAVKFTRGGGRVWVGLVAEDSDVLELTVRDTGVGIAPEFLPRVFDPFQQADGRVTRAHGGLGLGLAIVRHLVERHGGRVEAHSAGRDQGTTVRVRLPRSVHAFPSLHPSSVVHTGLLADDTLRGLRVLVVDDDDDARDMLATALEAAAAVVITASSAAAAYRSFTQSPVPDVLVSDIGMPDEDGCALLRRIRALPAHAGGSIPALAVTAYATSDDRARALRAGYAQHIPKPVDPHDLVAAVATLAAARLGD